MCTDRRIAVTIHSATARLDMLIIVLSVVDVRICLYLIETILISRSLLGRSLTKRSKLEEVTRVEDLIGVSRDDLGDAWMSTCARLFMY